VAQLDIPPRGTRGSRFTTFLFRLLRPLAKGEVARYRKNATTDKPGTFRGFPTVLVTTVGARSGIERTQVLGGFPEPDGSWLIVASNGGAAAHPQWFINLAKNPDKVWLEVGNRKVHVRPDELTGAEYEAAYGRIAAASPGYGKYRKVTDREIPVIRLTPIS
jgi:deazaflavin-dependent oxidoreductase (nitroreductase family)